MEQNSGGKAASGAHVRRKFSAWGPWKRRAHRPKPDAFSTARTRSTMVDKACGSWLIMCGGAAV